MKEDWETALKWGLTIEEIKKWAKTNYLDLELYVTTDYTVFGKATIYNFPGDCGALTISNAGDLDEVNIKAIEELASINGFSKIFATIVTRMDTTTKQNYLDLWKDWTIVDISTSNRNPDKTDIVLFKRIDCKYKGY